VTDTEGENLPDGARILFGWGRKRVGCAGWSDSRKLEKSLRDVSRQGVLFFCFFLRTKKMGSLFKVSGLLLGALVLGRYKIGDLQLQIRGRGEEAENLGTSIDSLLSHFSPSGRKQWKFLETRTSHMPAAERGVGP
jgi:hypothetical protein